VREFSVEYLVQVVDGFECLWFCDVVEFVVGEVFWCEVFLVCACWELAHFCVDDAHARFFEVSGGVAFLDELFHLSEVVHGGI